MDCQRKYFQSVAELEEYYENTEGALLEFLVRSVLDHPADLPKELVLGCKNLGIASGIVTRVLDRSLKMRRSGMDPGFPLDLVGRFGFSPAKLLDSAAWLNGPDLSPLIQKIGEMAASRQEAALSDLKIGLATLKRPQRKLIRDPLLHYVQL